MSMEFSGFKGTDVVHLFLPVHVLLEFKGLSNMGLSMMGLEK